jgi:hypothetical protein
MLAQREPRVSFWRAAVALAIAHLQRLFLRGVLESTKQQAKSVADAD